LGDWFLFSKGNYFKKSFENAFEIIEKEKGK
jgi:hypothetical protein